MKPRNDKQLVVGLDIGTSKVVAIVGEYEPGEPITVIGIGTHVSRGMKRGSVVDIESTVHSIQRAVEEAELMAGCDIRSVYASISGSHLETRNSHGNAAIRDREVTASDLEQVLEAASAVAIPADRKVLYKESQEYRIDGQDGIRSPVGMSGVRLEANVHLVTGAAAAVQNITKCIQRCGLAVDELVPSAVASAKAVLTDDERELGVCLVDIGAGTTDIAIYTQGSIRHTASLPVGGDQVTSDIAYGVHTPTAHAEEIKIKYACAQTGLAHAEETIQVPSVGDRPPRRLARQSLAQIGAGALRGNLRDGAGPAAPLRLREPGRRRRGADRRRLEDGRRAGAGRRDLPQDGAHRRAATDRRFGRRRRQPAARHRHGLAPARFARRRHARGRADRRQRRWRGRQVARLAHPEFLMTVFQAAQEAQPRAEGDSPTTTDRQESRSMVTTTTTLRRTGNV